MSKKCLDQWNKDFVNLQSEYVGQVLNEKLNNTFFTHFTKLESCNCIVIGHVLCKIYIVKYINDIRLTSVVNKFVDHSGVVGASPVCAAPTTSSFAI